MTQLIETSTEETSTITKRLAKVFSNGNSIGVRLPYMMAAKHRLDSGNYVLCEDLPSGILIKKVKEELL